MNTKDWLEKYIQQNRPSFDVHKAPDELWVGLEKRLDQKGQGSRFITLSVRMMAAVFLGVLVCGAFLGKMYFSNSTQGIDPAYATEMRMVEDHYSHQVNLKIDEVKQHNLYDSEVAGDMGQLDKVYNELKSEMLSKKDINNEDLMREMISNYRIRLSLLETLLDKHRKYEEEKTHTIY
ncbi:MAG: hypothetical protein IPN29_16500 [Saprospiraceae bacterium]|nr:hypothetical protein [Saprospiraceae bacterium]